MAERTKRGEEERKREDEVMTTGKPVEVATTGATRGGGNVVNTTKDKGVEPADDKQRGSDKKS